MFYFSYSKKTAQQGMGPGQNLPSATLAQSGASNPGGQVSDPMSALRSLAGQGSGGTITIQSQPGQTQMTASLLGSGGTISTMPTAAQPPPQVQVQSLGQGGMQPSPGPNVPNLTQQNMNPLGMQQTRFLGPGGGIVGSQPSLQQQQQRPPMLAPNVQLQIRNYRQQQQQQQQQQQINFNDGNIIGPPPPPPQSQGQVQQLWYQKQQQQQQHLLAMQRQQQGQFPPPQAPLYAQRQRVAHPMNFNPHQQNFQGDGAPQFQISAATTLNVTSIKTTDGFTYPPSCQSAAGYHGTSPATCVITFAAAVNATSAVSSSHGYSVQAVWLPQPIVSPRTQPIPSPRQQPAPSPHPHYPAQIHSPHPNLSAAASGLTGPDQMTSGNDMMLTQLMNPVSTHPSIASQLQSPANQDLGLTRDDSDMTHLSPQEQLDKFVANL